MYGRTAFVLAILFAGVFASPALAQDAKNSRKVGSFRLLKVIDGDTIRVEVDGRPTSLRLLGIDTEECFHDDKRRSKAANSNFEQYVKGLKKGSPHPSKYPTPFGEAARDYAVKFFANVKNVEVENDDPNEKTGHFGRMLSYVFIVKDGKRVHYNAEVVRNGYSPYYVKYGRSRSYEKEFKAAELEAKEAKKGMWGDWKTMRCYPDYDKRLKWWGDRADLLDQWRKRAHANKSKPAAEQENLVSLNDAKGMESLRKLSGKTVTVFGSIDRIRHPAGKGSTVVLSAKRERVDFYLSGRLKESGQFTREFAILKGTVTVQGKSIIVKDAKLLLPAIKVTKVDPKEKTSASSQPINNSPGKELLPFIYNGDVHGAIKHLKTVFRLNVAYGPVTNAVDSPYNRVVAMGLRKSTADEAIHAVARAANLKVVKVSRYVFVLKDNAMSKQELLIEELELKLLNKVVKGPASNEDREKWIEDVQLLLNTLGRFKKPKAELKKWLDKKKFAKSRKSD
ncbi:MAG: thermonuclease family protein [Planctomycetota bacterium]|nr:thermonuclease family protein [Planctomycetota bacterium]